MIFGSCSYRNTSLCLAKYNNLDEFRDSKEKTQVFIKYIKKNL